MTEEEERILGNRILGLLIRLTSVNPMVDESENFHPNVCLFCGAEDPMSWPAEPVHENCPWFQARAWLTAQIGPLASP